MIKILLVEDDLSLSNSIFDFLDDFADVMQVFDGQLLTRFHDQPGG